MPLKINLHITLIFHFCIFFLCWLSGIKKKSRTHWDTNLQPSSPLIFKFESDQYFWFISDSYLFQKEQKQTKTNNSQLCYHQTTAPHSTRRPWRVTRCRGLNPGPSVCRTDVLPLNYISDSGCSKLTYLSPWLSIFIIFMNISSLIFFSSFFSFLLYFKCKTINQSANHSLHFTWPPSRGRPAGPRSRWWRSPRSPRPRRRGWRRSRALRTAACRPGCASQRGGRPCPWRQTTFWKGRTWRRGHSSRGGAGSVAGGWVLPSWCAQCRCSPACFMVLGMIF